jgi:hypothetical protein
LIFLLALAVLAVQLLQLIISQAAWALAVLVVLDNSAATQSIMELVTHAQWVLVEQVLPLLVQQDQVALLHLFQVQDLAPLTHLVAVVEAEL